MTKEEILDALDHLAEEIVEKLWESRPVVQDDDELREDPGTRRWARAYELVAEAAELLDQESYEPDCTVEGVTDANDR